MNRFASARDAKEFLVAQIAGEALREGVSLSEIERKMLYFSETGWILPDIDKVSEAFDREYDHDEYEKKITSLIRNARTRARKEDRQKFKTWSDAIRVLAKEDHYLVVMIEPAGGDLLRLWVTGLTIAGIALFAAVFVVPWFFVKLSQESIRSLLVWVAACVACVSMLSYVLLGREGTERLLTKVTGMLRTLFLGPK